MLKVVQDPAEPNSAGGSLLDEIVRDGARQMLAAALQAEVAAYRRRPPWRGRRRRVAGWWSATASTQPREVTTAAGAVPVRQPRVNDKRIDEATGERQPVLLGDPAGVVAEVARGWRRCCRCCICTACPARDFGPALEQFLGSDQGLSAATITRLTDAVARRGAGVQRPVAGRLRLRLRAGSTAST